MGGSVREKNGNECVESKAEIYLPLSFILQNIL